MLLESLWICVCVCVCVCKKKVFVRKRRGELFCYMLRGNSKVSVITDQGVHNTANLGKQLILFFSMRYVRFTDCVKILVLEGRKCFI